MVLPVEDKIQTVVIQDAMETLTILTPDGWRRPATFFEFCTVWWLQCAQCGKRGFWTVGPLAWISRTRECADIVIWVGQAIQCKYCLSIFQRR